VVSTTPCTTIGIVAGSGVQEPFQRQIVQAFEDCVERRGGKCQLYVGRPTRKGHRLDKVQIAQDVRQGRLGGVLTVSWSPHDSKADARLGATMQRAGVPVVRISSRGAPASVGVDLTSVGRLGA